MAFRFPCKRFFIRTFPILFALILVILICGFFMLHNYNYSRLSFYIKPRWATAKPHVINQSIMEYLQQNFFPHSPVQQQWIPECECYRPGIYHNEQLLENKTHLNSTCSDPGTHFFPNQKVVSFVMYFFEDPYLPSTNPSPLFYKKGIQINLEAMRQNYPGYTIRLYTNIPKDPSFCELYCDNPDLFWCDVRYVPGNVSKMFFTTWRFLPLGDPTVDIFLSRDLDSVLTEREAAVVHDWLNLTERKPIHLMRDKYEVHNTDMLGGLWGAKNGYFPKSGESNYNETAENLAKEIRINSRVENFKNMKDTGFDQYVLSETVFVKRASQIVAYDSYSCVRWSASTMVRPFPKQRKDNTSDFVGNTAFGKAKYRLEPCPVQCRPNWGKDWEYC